MGAQRGLRTLVIDLDAQANSTRYLLGPQADAAGPGVADFFEQSLKFTLREEGLEAFIVPSPSDALALDEDPLLAGDDGETFEAETAVPGGDETG